MIMHFGICRFTVMLILLFSCNHLLHGQVGDSSKIEKRQHAKQDKTEMEVERVKPALDTPPVDTDSVRLIPDTASIRPKQDTVTVDTAMSQPDD